MVVVAEGLHPVSSLSASGADLSEMSPSLTVAIAGASGFVGRALTEHLRHTHRVIALSRRAGVRDDGVLARACDLMRHDDAVAGLDGVDVAVYLVHSMMPSGRLVQGDFANIDLLAADNFARAAAHHGVRRIVYLGGLAPSDGAPPSAHLASRLEIERALGSHGVPVTALRAGLIFGAGGSSSRIVFNLARRLPVMVCPAWTATPTQPIGLDDVVALLAAVIADPTFEGRSWDIGAPDVMSYREMMALVGEAALGRRPHMVDVPLLSPRLSRLWVSLVTGAPRALVDPLVGSLSHPMLARDRALQEALGIDGASIREVLPEAVAADAAAGTPRAFEKAPHGPAEASRVLSIQRIPTHVGDTARGLVERYFGWLEDVFGAFLAVRRRGGTWEVGLRGPLRAPLLRLVPHLEAGDRVVLEIAGGLLVDTATPRGTFEFREVLGGEAVLVTIADFAPRLPWWLYVVTQAQAHAVVMALFGRHVVSSGPRSEPAPAAA
jgi:uncharacterized protein YbjT (DUF2867 family)